MTENKGKKLVWNNQDESRYNSLFNKLKETNPNIKKDDYILKFNKKKLQEFINKLELSVSTRESYFFLVSKWLQLNAPSNTSYINFRNMGFKLKQKREEEDSKNELDKKELENYRDYTYFVDILNAIDYKQIRTYRSHLQYLLLALLVKQPPLRTSFFSSATFHTKGGYDENKNYVMLLTTSEKKRVILYVGKDKVSNTKTFSGDIFKNNIEVEDKSLIDLIYYSFEKYPRTYLFENRGKPMQDETLLQYLREITKVSKINVDMMRSIYITHHYNQKLTFAEKDKLAQKMRHSVHTAELRYYKLLSRDSDDKVKDNRIKELEEQVKVLTEKLTNIENDKSNLKEEVNNLKDEKPKDPEWRKRRYDVIFRLNRKIQKDIKESTLEKFDIKYNKDTGKYY